ncbi:clan AA aspartic protease [Kamptonema sp. UHCC 0994]|uniref:clan AA aspartic protease n=1 Tax=Kamptonema sp. UHCC 0994 TaxID=3031329 RepID=UPI0023BA3963|nr:clan AA aspartic protease [Kamptonema sp. UHCC 0994]MDF0553821.1 clan AA aspartic protease [Kamptonema sp. UHCC 0994]
MKTENMGITYAEIELIRSDDRALFREGYIQEDQIKSVKVRALVDSGSSMLAITEAVKNQLNLGKLDEKQAELADGSIVRLEIVGPVEIRFENRITTVRAMVVPNSNVVLLGAIPMQDMDVLIDPKREQLIVNPESPDIARMLLK